MFILTAAYQPNTFLPDKHKLGPGLKKWRFYTMIRTN
jgi:hypothetical protein